MKIGILSLSYGWHGEATAAATWTKYLRKFGHRAKLFTMSRSGRRLKRMRTDYPVTILKMKPTEETMSFLNSLDIVISFGTGTSDEEEGDLPPYFDSLSKMDPPLIIYMPNAGQVRNGYKNSTDFLQLPTFSASLFLRDSIKDFCYNDLSEYFNGKPHCVIKHPVELPSADPIPKDQGIIVSTSRIAPSKNIHKILRAYRDFDLEEVLTTRFDIWGDKGESRFGYLLEKEFGDFFLSKYKGPYSHNELDIIYDNARFCFDLTNFLNDGGVQNVYLESVKRSTVPIVMPGWNINESCLVSKSADPDDIADVVAEACTMSEQYRLQLLAYGLSYIKRVHDPEEQTTRLVDYCRSLV